ncbi:hypothetical protein PN36_18565 [Candidatus Thiomargarita nelsonii]|uniref:Release factor glutamine methyltransferase n=1 Tax=Candidatus Thiomargarita nelsonii TaxID=1003181 RepID=A0A0A6S5Y2_9GAMM|nr:hypothetical protein PN36_18565 [Candidatus Thiomargarita nelsonii]
MTKPSIHTLLSKAVKKLPRLEVEILLCHILGVTRTYLLAWPEKFLTAKQYSQFQTLLARRVEGEPIAYITGYKEFWSLDLQVTENTLIPRPETELLVEQALARLSPGALVIDLGTGSGAIALAIAHERSQCRVLATDKSIAALNVARANAQRLGLHRVQFLISDWCSDLGDIKAELIVSNPPYVAIADPHLKGEVRYEPHNALVAGKDGLADIRRLIAFSQSYLVPQGWLLLEHGYDQAEAVRVLFKQHTYESITTYQDLAGIPRVTVGQKTSSFL